jgi:hypothetical protein
VNDVFNDGWEKLFWFFFLCTLVDDVIHMLCCDFTSKWKHHRLGLSSIEEALPTVTNCIFVLAASLRVTSFFRTDLLHILVSGHASYSSLSKLGCHR